MQKVKNIEHWVNDSVPWHYYNRLSDLKKITKVLKISE